MDKKQFIRFIVVGCINTFSGYGVYLLLNIYFSYTFAFSIGYLVGLITSYFLSANWVFEAGTSIKSFVLFPLVYLVQYVISFVLLKFLIEKMHMHESLAPLLVTGLTIPITFLSSKLLFKLTRKTP